MSKLGLPAATSTFETKSMVFVPNRRIGQANSRDPSMGPSRSRSSGSLPRLRRSQQKAWFLFRTAESAKPIRGTPPWVLVGVEARAPCRDLDIRSKAKCQVSRERFPIKESSGADKS
jgi:hypothetical protein